MEGWGEEEGWEAWEAWEEEEGWEEEEVLKLQTHRHRIQLKTQWALEWIWTSHCRTVLCCVLLWTLQYCALHVFLAAALD